jgi:hypothetical protein
MLVRALFLQVPDLPFHQAILLEAAWSDVLLPQGVAEK